MKENRKYISDKKQITYILTQNGIAIPVHFKFFRVWYATTKNNWSFQTILTSRHNCLLGGMLVALSRKFYFMNLNRYAFFLHPQYV